MAFYLAIAVIHGAQAQPMQIQSTNMSPNGFIHRAQIYTHCNGLNRSPQLSWFNEPAGTQSFALTLFDPDAPTGHGWWHWIALDIPANIHNLPEGFSSSTSTSLHLLSPLNDFGNTGYGGPCPPSGDKPHHYVLTLYALNTAHCDLPPQAKPSLFLHWLNAHQLSSAQLIGRYGH